MYVVGMHGVDGEFVAQRIAKPHTVVGGCRAVPTYCCRGCRNLGSTDGLGTLAGRILYADIVDSGMMANIGEARRTPFAIAAEYQTVDAHEAVDDYGIVGPQRAATDVGKEG